MRSSVWSIATMSRRRSSWKLYVPQKNTHRWWWSWLLLIWWCNHCVYSLQESLPPAVQRPTLPCVWPMALSSTKRSEVNAWFDRRLPNYLGFLTTSLISPSSTHNASCLAFQKLYVWFIQGRSCCIYDHFVKMDGHPVFSSYSVFQFLANTTTLLQTSRGKMCSTPSGPTSPQVSPPEDTDLE